jgi:hypothetical protein
LDQGPTGIPALGDRVTTWRLAEQAPPLFIGAKDGAFAGTSAFLDWVRDHRATLDDLILKHGAIVLRGFPVATAEDFNDFAGNFPQYDGNYVGGGAGRAPVVGRVMEATRLARESFICLHQEMAYLQSYPPRLAFFARKPAESGGETIIGSMREFTRRLPAGIRDRLERLGVRGVRNYAPAGAGKGELADLRYGVAWDESFGTADKAEVERLCAERGLEPIWRDDGGLIVVTQLDPFAVHPITGERFYRSIIHTSNIDTVTGKLTHKMEGAYATGYTFGDGTAMTIEEGQSLHDVLNDITMCWEWQGGDLMIVDNLQVAHGRNRFQGERETLVALFAH